MRWLRLRYRLCKISIGTRRLNVLGLIDTAPTALINTGMSEGGADHPLAIQDFDYVDH
jgi:hypothetical protein